MKPYFIFRPEPGRSVSVDVAEAAGLDVRGAPLFEIEPVAWEAPPAEGFDGLLIGSANVFRHGGKQLEAFSKIPVHAVGQRTADAARAAGFIVGRTGRGGLQSLLDKLAGRELRLLRLAGEDRVALRVPDGIKVETRVLYRANPEGLGEEDIEALRNRSVVALHSGAAARRLIDEFERHKLDASAVDIVAIGPRVAEMSGNRWRSVHIAKAPNDSDMLALAKSLCQTHSD